MTAVWNFSVVDLSETKRSKSVLKIVKNPEFLKFRYTIMICDDCFEYFDKHDTTKNWQERQVDDNFPESVICQKFWKKYQKVLCTDCVKLRSRSTA